MRRRDMQEYNAWRGMKGRCLNPNNDKWKHYGGRGITVCPAWVKSFDAFYAHIGPKPSPKHTLDRINNDGNYEPGNCRWAARAEQRPNNRNVRRLPDGRRAHDVAKTAGISTITFCNRLKSGWTEHEALTTPVKHAKHKK